MRLARIARILRGLFSAPRSTPVAGRKQESRPAASDTRSGAARLPGQYGPEATAEVPLRILGRSRIVFDPRVDRQPDPGEVVWTWVPYEENDGRGKDRPVVIVARDSDRSVFAVQLTSKPHDDDARHFVFVGSGPWDGRGRPSWARLDRAFRVFESGMRREASSVSRAQFDVIAKALKSRA